MTVSQQPVLWLTVFTGGADGVYWWRRQCLLVEETSGISVENRVFYYRLKPFKNTVFKAVWFLSTSQRT